MMRLVAIRAIVCAALLLTGVLSSVSFAGTTDPIGTITSAVSTVLGQTTVASNLTGTATSATNDASGSSGSLSGAGGSLSGTATALTGSGTGSSSSTSGGSSSSGSTGSGKSSSGGSASGSNPGSPRSRFDRLPRRYEILLERIEFGHHARANMARLRALLASASPDFRRRLSRLIRAEIRRLERGGLTHRERAAVRRLRSLLPVVAGRPAASRAATAAASFRSARLAAGGVLAATAIGTVSGSVALAARGRPPKGGISVPHVPGFLTPAPPSGPDWWAIVAIALSVLGAFFLLTLLLAGRRHDSLSSLRGSVTAIRPDIMAFGMALLLGLIVGAAVTLLLSLVH